MIAKKNIVGACTCAAGRQRSNYTHNNRFIQSGYTFLSLCLVIDWTRIRMNFNFYWNGLCDEIALWKWWKLELPRMHISIATHINLINYFSKWISRAPQPYHILSLNWLFTIRESYNYSCELPSQKVISSVKKMFVFSRDTWSMQMCSMNLKNRRCKSQRYK